MFGNPESDAAGQVRADYGGWVSGPCLDADATALGLLRAEYPSWLIWGPGKHTGQCWACPPPGSACRSLLSAGTPAALAALIAEVTAWEGR